MGSDSDRSHLTMEITIRNPTETSYYSDKYLSRRCVIFIVSLI